MTPERLRPGVTRMWSRCVVSLIYWVTKSMLRTDGFKSLSWIMLTTKSGAGSLELSLLKSGVGKHSFCMNG